MMKRIVFLGSKLIGYRCLEFLIKNQNPLRIEIVACLTNDNKGFDNNLSILQLCKNSGISVLSSVESLLYLSDIDVIISVQYHQILKQKHIDCAKQIAVNLHMAPLPEFRGCNQFSFAIYQGVNEFGTTLHKMDTGIDSGDILYENRFSIPAGCNVKQLYEMTFSSSIELFVSSIGKIIAGDYSPVAQSELVPKMGTQIFYRKDIEALKEIELTEDIKRRVRATAMPGFEPPFAYDGEKKIYLVPEEDYNKLRKQV
jgi:methionyl-tRNA formyltransferase